MSASLWLAAELGYGSPMWSYRHVTESAASARAVWDCLTDVQGWNEHAGIKMAKLHGALTVGSKITTKCVGLPSSTSTITVLEPPSVFTHEDDFPGFRGAFEHRVEPDEGGTRLVEIVTLTGPLSGLVGRVLDRRLRAAVVHNLGEVARRASQYEPQA